MNLETNHQKHSLFHKDYRDTLRKEFVNRCRINPRYSLNAFARALEMPPSRISEVFNYKKGLSLKSAQKITEKLSYTSMETKVFLTSVKAFHARNPIVKKEAQQELQYIFNTLAIQPLKQSQFEIISDWYHYAILELISLSDFSEDPHWMAKRLGITLLEVKTAIENLKSVGLLKKTPEGLQTTNSFTGTQTDTSQRAIKQYHEKILQKASEALYFQDVKERDFHH